MTYYGDRAPRVTGTVVTLTVLGFLCFSMRVYVRVTNRAWGIDDWCMVLASFPFLALSISCLGSSFSGVGIRSEHLTPVEQVNGLKWFFFFEVFYCAAVIPIKLSISFMLMRIASNKKAFINSLWVVSAMFTTMNLIALLYIVFQCKPVSYAWDKSTPGGKCNPAVFLQDIYYATTAVNIATDWFSAVLPIPLLWNLQLNRNAKLSVGVLLSLGALASLSACIRLVYTVNLTNATDYLFGLGDIVIWGYAENGVGMVVANVSTLRPLFRRLLNLGGSQQEATPVHKRSAWSGSSRVRKENEWVPLEEARTGVAISKSQVKDTDSEELILGSNIKVTQSIIQDVSYDKSKDGRQ